MSTLYPNRVLFSIVLAFAVSLALVYQVPQGFADRTARGHAGLGQLAAKIVLPQRATLRLVAVEERDARVHAAAWSFTLPTSGLTSNQRSEKVGPAFADELARGIAEAGKQAPGANVEVRARTPARVQGEDGGRVDVDLNFDDLRMREIIFYAPADDQVAVLVYLCPLDELARYEPRFVAAAQAQPRARRWPWRKLLEGAAFASFLVTLWGARAARKRLQATRTAGS
jgi:hypothetical protein